ncbi:NADH oxidase [Actinoplanes cyaneus]|uniref:NADH oxidase n=1 Tax=Actinoplanes cyaneus TaxID=52696 RepID=A0A919IKM6_9ACTN|nr:FAD-dependent oxidoreductase [Actinoplanes cyaneus]MCW2141096.1 2,4-dienoyl-CoA reductase [Actinoplanes cyaneus]GID67158.1 NADH oxidase [Actinoplanes cyaneus]
MLLGRPLRVGRHELRNRVVSPPMERNYGTTDGRVTDRYVAYLRARAAGGAALVFTEATYVRADGRGRVRQLGAHGDHVIAGLRVLAGAVHAEGALLGVELNHAGRVGDPAVCGFQPVAPSAVPFRGRPPRELETTEVGDLVDAFAAAARRCADAGVDVLEIHAAHGYLIHQFLSPRTNRRTDRYGDPALFLTEILQSVRRSAPHTTVFLRLSAFEGVPDGLDADATLAVTERLPLNLVDALDISAGCYEAGEWMVQPGEIQRGVLAPYAARFRRFGKPVGVAGRIVTGESAETILQSGAADLVAVGRAQHADPQWVATTLAGEHPRPCIGCNQGCIDSLHTQQPIWCVVNPRTGREHLAPAPPVPSRRVLVIGAGVAGLEAARSAALAGHVVSLWEAEPVIGGAFRLAAALAGKPEFGRLLDWYAAELVRLSVELRLSTRADATTVTRLAPDIVVPAVGGTGVRPPIPGIDHPRVHDLDDWLRHPRTSDRVTVWGADRVGLALADAAATAGCRTTLISAGSELAPEAGPREKGLTVRRLAGSPGVEIRLETTLEAIEEHHLLLGHAGRRQWTRIAGPVVVSQGVTPRHLDIGTGPWQVVPAGEWPQVTR